MPSYWMRNWGAKLRTFGLTVRRVRNWPAAVGMRLRPGSTGIRLLELRLGLQVACRGGSSDWDVTSELAIQGGYGLALDYLRAARDEPLVLDLGGNIGVFSLLAAHRHERARVHVYEPAPPNARMIEINRLLNASLGERIQLRRSAVGGLRREAELFYDEGNPQASGLLGRKGTRYPVQIETFAEVAGSLGGPVALVKMDIEGAEYEVLEHTPAEIWGKVGALAVELHEIPGARFTPRDFLGRMAEAGFNKILQEPVGPSSYFMWKD